MDPRLSEWLNLVFRWIHVVAGIAWIGHLYFFNWVNSQFAKAYDPESKKKLLPELMPRALYWFRWGAMYTFVTGVLLLAIVIYDGGVLVRTADMSVAVLSLVGFLSLVVAWVVYDMLWKAMAKNEMAGVVVSFLLFLGTAFGLSRIFPARAVFIHLGSILGTIMFTNVWMRIWPSQRKIIAAAAGGPAVDPAIPALAGLRSKQNTYMSVPLTFFMVSNHFPTAMSFPTIGGKDMGWLGAGLFVAVGWIVTKMLFKKSAGEAPKKY